LGNNGDPVGLRARTSLIWPDEAPGTLDRWHELLWCDPMAPARGAPRTMTATWDHYKSAVE